jgi:hypothetical protein
MLGVELSLDIGGARGLSWLSRNELPVMVVGD